MVRSRGARQIALNRRVMRDNRECFAGDDVEPLVPTLLSGLYANRFSSSAGSASKTCWTIYNTNYRTVAAEVIAVKHVDGAQYRDELTGQPLQLRIARRLGLFDPGISHRAMSSWSLNRVPLALPVARLT